MRLPTSEGVRFLTYNIRLGRQMGIGPVAELLQELQPDVAAIQEVGSNWRRGPSGDTTSRLAHRSGMRHRRFVPTIGRDSSVRYGHALLSRWPLRDVRDHHLPVVEDEPRIVLSATVSTPNRRIRVVTTHLSHHSADRRIQGPELVELHTTFETADDISDVLVLMGDLNEPRDSPDAWLEELLESCDDAGRCDPSPTFENPVPDERIDYLLASNATWRCADVPDRPDTSDHRPVVADLEC